MAGVDFLVRLHVQEAADVVGSLSWKCYLTGRRRRRLSARSGFHVTVLRKRRPTQSGLDVRLSKFPSKQRAWISNIRRVEPLQDWQDQLPRELLQHGDVGLLQEGAALSKRALHALQCLGAPPRQLHRWRKPSRPDGRGCHERAARSGGSLAHRERAMHNSTGRGRPVSRSVIEMIRPGSMQGTSTLRMFRPRKTLQ